MATKDSRSCHSLYYNLLLIDQVEDKLARDQSPLEDSHSGSTSPALSCNSTPGPALVPALVFALVPALMPVPISFDKLFR